jgi:hypothetical protein
MVEIATRVLTMREDLLCWFFIDCETHNGSDRCVVALRGVMVSRGWRQKDPKP